MAKIALDVAQNRVSSPVIFRHTGAFSISMIEASEIEVGLSLAYACFCDCGVLGGAAG